MPIVPSHHASRTQPSFGHQVRLRPLGEPPRKVMSQEGYRTLLCLVGYLDHLTNTVPSASLRPVPGAMTKRRRVVHAQDNELSAQAQKVVATFARQPSTLVEQLMGRVTAPPLLQPSPPRPSLPPRPLALADERTQAINEALSFSWQPATNEPVAWEPSAWQPAALIRPIYAPLLEMVVDAHTLRQAYPDYANEVPERLAQLVGGMVDTSLTAFGKLWRARAHLDEDVFLKSAVRHLFCPLSDDVLAQPMLTLDGMSRSLAPLAAAYAPAQQHAVGAPPIGPSVWGLPNRRLATIAHALFAKEFDAERHRHPGGRFEIGALLIQWNSLLEQHQHLAQPLSESRIAAAGRQSRQDGPALAAERSIFLELDGLDGMRTPEGAEGNFRGELLRRGAAIDELMFQQLQVLIADGNKTTMSSAARTRLVIDAAMLRAPINSTRKHLLEMEAFVFLRALGISEDLGDMVRRIFFEIDGLDTSRQTLANQLRCVNIGWLQRNDPAALSYLQMSWSHILAPTDHAPLFRTKWQAHSPYQRLDSLTLSLWLEGRDFSSASIFMPFFDLTAQAPQLFFGELSMPVRPPPTPTGIDEPGMLITRSRSDSRGSSTTTTSSSSRRTLRSMFHATFLSKSYRPRRTLSKSCSSQEQLRASEHSGSGSERQIALAD